MQRTDPRHLHLTSNKLALGAVHEIAAEAVLAGVQGGTRRQRQLLGPAVEVDQDMDLVGHRTLAHHLEHVAVEKFEMPAGERVDLVPRLAE